MAVTTRQVTAAIAAVAAAKANVTSGRVPYPLKPGNVADADAGTLDWYEEGTFTPTIAGTTTAGVAVGASGSTGHYTRIGNRVFFATAISQVSHNGTGGVRIGGLPYAGHATASLSMLTVYAATGLPFTGPHLTGYVEAGASTFLVRQSSTAGAGSGVPLPAGAMTIYVTGSYQV